MPTGGDAVGNIPLDLPRERHERGLKVSELVKLAGVGRTMIQAIEAGRTDSTIETRAKLRRALDSVEPIRPTVRPELPVEWQDRLQHLGELVVDLQRRMLDAEQQIHELRAAKRQRRPGDDPRQ